jgi:hypothetical protein
MKRAGVYALFFAGGAPMRVLRREESVPGIVLSEVEERHLTEISSVSSALSRTHWISALYVGPRVFRDGAGQGAGGEGKDLSHSWKHMKDIDML